MDPTTVIMLIGFLFIVLFLFKLIFTVEKNQNEKKENDKYIHNMHQQIHNF